MRLHERGDARSNQSVGLPIPWGTGADGSLVLKAVNENGGLVIAQNLDEAACDGVTRSAILTGAVDPVLPVAKIFDALIKHGRRTPRRPTKTASMRTIGGRR